MKHRIITLFTIGVIGVITYSVFYYSSVEEITITVTDKERIIETDGDQTTSKYLVFCNGETFENQDEFFMGKWNSSDIQGKLKNDTTYTVKVIGWRLPFFSMYRNIISIK